MNANSENNPPEQPERLDKDHGDEVPPPAEALPAERKKSAPRTGKPTSYKLI